MKTFVIFDTPCFGQTMGGALIRVVPLLGIIRYVVSMMWEFSQISVTHMQVYSS